MEAVTIRPAVPEDAPALLAELAGAVPCAQRIGELTDWVGGPRITLG